MEYILGSKKQSCGQCGVRLRAMLERILNPRCVRQSRVILQPFFSTPLCVTQRGVRLRALKYSVGQKHLVTLPV